MTVKPFSVIERRAVYGQPVRVIVNDRTVAEFGTRAAADAHAQELNKRRQAAERALKKTDPAEYWRLRYEASQRRVSELEEQLRQRAGSDFRAIADRIIARRQRRAGGRKSKRSNPLTDRIKAVMARQKRNGVGFQALMEQWKVDHIDGLRCTYLGVGKFEFNDENSADDLTGAYAWVTLKSYYARA